MENIKRITSFEDDLFDLKGFKGRLEVFIETEQNYVEGGLVIALSSKYGSGKTTFLDMWKSSIDNDKKNPDKEGELVLVSLNAWESDYFGDPLFAIVSGLVEQIGKDDKNAVNIMEAAKDLGWFSAAIFSQVSRKLTGVDPVAAGDVAEKKKNKRKEASDLCGNAFDLYLHRRAAMEALKKAITNFVETAGDKVIFLVDELDRCRPDYAISYLETIKHIFDVNGAVFILAADRAQLENSAKTAFGSDLDFEEYYRKFIHREVSLPAISEEGYSKIVDTYVSRYSEHDDVRYCFMKTDIHRKDDIAELLRGLKLTPRQIQEVFRIMGHVLSTQEDNKGRINWCIGVGSMLMASLKVADKKAFHSLGNGEMTIKEGGELFDYIDSDGLVRWLTILFTGGGLKIDSKEAFLQTLIDEGVEKEDKLRMNEDEINAYYRGWGNMHYRPKKLHQTYKFIEEIMQWK